MPSLPPAIHLSFTTDGDGPLVVALHDVGRPSADLRKALKPLLKHHRVMVPELRGHGESPSPAGPWSIDDFASDVARLVAGEGGGAVMLGIGLGGATALALALGHPGLVAGLVLSGIGPRGEDPDGRDRWMLIARALRERNRDEGQALAAEAMATRPDWRGAPTWWTPFAASHPPATAPSVLPARPRCPLQRRRPHLRGRRRRVHRTAQACRW